MFNSEYFTWSLLSSVAINVNLLYFFGVGEGYKIVLKGVLEKLGVGPDVFQRRVIKKSQKKGGENTQKSH